MCLYLLCCVYRELHLQRERENYQTDVAAAQVRDPRLLRLLLLAKHWQQAPDLPARGRLSVLDSILWIQIASRVHGWEEKTSF